MMVQIVRTGVALKYLSNFRITLEMKINLILTWSITCFIIDNSIAGQERIFTITDTNLYVPIITLSIQDNAKLLQQLKSGFKRTINWNKYELKLTVQAQNQYLDSVINPSSQGVNRLFVLSFQNNGSRTSYTIYNLPLVEVNCYNVVIDGRNFFEQPVKNNFITYDNIWKIATGQGDDYTTGCLLDYNYFTNYYKLIAIDLSKKQALDADPKAIQQISFTANLDRNGNTTMIFIIEEAKETLLDFLQAVKVL